ncbi:hypothetical protein PR048_016971 [Dryococelus australis]|uniref:Transposable element Tc3 transposase n=1 Tax=Dryococelus australis TaxID=614101 RepID=A0ABQ9H876_9NEOP|nr:hypothetical protein PR048_016971 [Dryococelus australis]
MTEENEMKGRLIFVNSPKKVYTASSTGTVLAKNITATHSLLKQISSKLYRPKLLHGLLEDDPEQRLQSCEIMCYQISGEPDLLDMIVWLDAACFKLSHNCVYWTEEKSRLTIQMQLNQPGVTVWGAISIEGVVGPNFFHGTVDGKNFLNMLRDVVVSQFRTRTNFNELYFQQDGRTPHCASVVSHYLDDVFLHHWIGQRGSIDWPPRSPDLKPMDFFFRRNEK